MKKNVCKKKIAVSFSDIFVFAKNLNRSTTHLGSDADAKVSGHDREDIAEAMDRIYRENLNEKTDDHS